MTEAPLTRARALWQDWVTPGQAPRPLPREMLVAVYRLWLLAFLLKMLGSSWDVSWHFRWLRDDLAPPHLLNSVGTALAIALVTLHSYTGYGVDRRALRLMQVGMSTFLVAIPLDIINHRINGLDITTWSATHALLYLGTAIVLAGVIRGWWRYGPPGHEHRLVISAFWLFFLENVMFAAGQQEYGVVAVAAWDAGRPEAEPELLQFAANQAGHPMDRNTLVSFALPVPPWVYLAWIITAAMLVLVVARWTVGWRWTATSVTVAYLAYRCTIWVLLAEAGFPRSAVPFLLLAGALAVDAVMAPHWLHWLARPVCGGVMVAGAVCGGAWLQELLALAPPLDYHCAPAAAVVLIALWLGVTLLVRTSGYARWLAER
ncbi:MAG: hypothetical protein JO100_07495 [Pseudonocardia sp.]|nr:hypothetical protein [Pseudonocardia sp.]